jgi:hypothetical protein
MQHGQPIIKISDLCSLDQTSAQWVVLDVSKFVLLSSSGSGIQELSFWTSCLLNVKAIHDSSKRPKPVTHRRGVAFRPTWVLTVAPAGPDIAVTPYGLVPTAAIVGRAVWARGRYPSAGSNRKGCWIAGRHTGCVLLNWRSRHWQAGPT